MTRERSFKHFYPIPHDGGFIEPIIHIEYEVHDWTDEHAGSIDVLDAYLSSFKYIKQDMTPTEVKVGEMPPVLFEWKKAVMSDAEAESAQAWLDQTPLDFFYDAAFENECEEWNAPPLFLQP
jgi:hypothetical protein